MSNKLEELTSLVAVYSCTTYTNAKAQLKLTGQSPNENATLNVSIKFDKDATGFVDLGTTTDSDEAFLKFIKSIDDKIKNSVAFKEAINETELPTEEIQ